LKAIFDEYLPAVEEYLRGLEFVSAGVGRCAPQLDTALRYSLEAGGKRLRPVLSLMGYNLLAEDWRRALPVAAAYELVHTYSLIHDDLPAMDDDDLRRGRPTSHKVFGEALAILAGDGLLTEAFRLLAEEVAAAPEIRLRLVAGLSRAAGGRGMVGGQAIDILAVAPAAERPEDSAFAAIDVDREELLEILHRHKTGALITGALLAGAELGGARAEELRRLEEFGQVIGLAFQVADDILDEVGDEAALGKDIGSDREQGKLTYVSLYGLEAARERLAELQQTARRLLAPFGERAKPLLALADYIVERDR
jgi:geranylgeranyl diphosphate synthase type II